ncbi:MAG: GNAT family N-acetyltransferase [Clostridiaceae bacterium]|jgi:ribosomal protein S18 acetylase RimI-like enzyme|nr:GNAT family N-acetyltransferase [Clostridiaceae bacterium]
MIIRKMTIADYDSVYDLWLNTPGMGLNNMDDSKQGIEKFLRRNPETCFVAEKDNRIIGVILCGNDGRRGYIYHTAVLVTERKRGVGTALVDAAVKALKNEGINKAALVVFSKNELGNSFWEKRGFITREDLIYRNRSINELTRIDT